MNNVDFVLNNAAPRQATTMLPNWSLRKKDSSTACSLMPMSILTIGGNSIAELAPATTIKGQWSRSRTKVLSPYQSVCPDPASRIRISRVRLPFPWITNSPLLLWEKGRWSVEKVTRVTLLSGISVKQIYCGQPRVANSVVMLSRLSANRQAALIRAITQGFRGSPRKPANQRHRPARFPHVKIRSDPAGDSTRIASAGGEQSNRSATCSLYREQPISVTFYHTIPLTPAIGDEGQHPSAHTPGRYSITCVCFDYPEENGWSTPSSVVKLWVDVHNENDEVIITHLMGYEQDDKDNYILGHHSADWLAKKAFSRPAVSGVVCTNRTIASSNTNTNRTGVNAAVDIASVPRRRYNYERPLLQRLVADYWLVLGSPPLFTFYTPSPSPPSPAHAS
ncbi:hypothetical protein PR048_003133 [Dryococelus australis]|uniref:Uncharacterized protein n=1 Tax=Dryococelus australis TaxID=614101 RepID=A0ABQ9IM46_9NEOP|nr:hypothetical protein PR048_003133 [Dryococelus australis]